ncbi:hypothetical protein [Bosea sp. OK403]|uniref:hypothetical protein n=1 Tax=Bosea sp. OK403 TaxID=1855286 RepID=UPI001587710F|nr:hypothetical protein [Bosea sp. OK403]
MALADHDDRHRQYIEGLHLDRIEQEIVPAPSATIEKRHCHTQHLSVRPQRG